MKFGRAYTIYVQTEAQHFIPQCPHVEFKRFKKLLKRCPHLIAPPASDASVGASSSVSAAVAGADLSSECDNEQNLTDSNLFIENSTTKAVVKATHVASSACSACDAQFFPDLDKAVSKVVGCFNACAEDLLRQHMASGLWKFFMRLRRKMAGDTATMIQVGNMLVSYGCMNSLAVRKILKKYDKIHSSESGRAFKSRLQRRRMELLQSPLLIELGALAVNLLNTRVPSSSLQPPQPQTLTAGSHSCNFDDEKQTITYTLPDGLRLDFDLMCSICLEVVFDPIALTCGHIFCNSCACTAASVSMFHGVSSASMRKKCPVCRQTGVYGGAVPMGELHLLVSERCSKYYAERLPLEREKRILDAKIHWESQTQKFLGL